MKFYSDKECNIAVWDGSKGLVFIDGIYETKNKQEIETLNRLGYRHDGEVVVDGRETEQGDEEGRKIEGEQGKVDADKIAALVVDRLKKVDYTEKTNTELKAILDEKGIEYKDRATKSELIELLGGD